MQIIGNEDVIKKIRLLIEKWKPGKAALIYGPTGIGKTSIINSIAKDLNYDLIEVDASDKRSAQQMSELLSGTISQSSLFKKGKIILIDELDGITGSDRGAIQEIIRIIKKSKFPIVLITCNPYTQQLQPLSICSIMIQLKAPEYKDILNLLKNIAKEESIEVSEDTLKKIAVNCNGDVRSAIIDVKNKTNALSEREHVANIFEVLYKIFKTKDQKEIKETIANCDKKPEEVLLWIEENIINEFKDPKELAEAFQLLAKINMKKYSKSSTDLMTCFSNIHTGKTGFTSYKSFKYSYNRKPDLIELANKMHCSVRKTQRELPLLEKFISQNS